MDKPRIASRKGFFVELKKGERRLWCSCGLSEKQPFCDGAHKGTEFLPLAYKAQDEIEELIFCGCKQTKNPPFCDGTHNNLEDGYREDDPGSEENQHVQLRDAKGSPRAMLDGGCYVFSTAKAEYKRNGAMDYCRVIDEEYGAKHQSCFLAKIDALAASPIISSQDKHVILFVAAGDVKVEIGDQILEAGKSDSVYVRPGESFRITNLQNTQANMFISICPGVCDLAFKESFGQFYDAEVGARLGRVNEAEREQMAERYFQVLIDSSNGCETACQFIGFIPPSKSEPHRHLYEEALFILSGSGLMWTEKWKARVSAGDVIFLPSKQIHSLQCTEAEGMDVVGVIHPGNNPGINY